MKSKLVNTVSRPACGAVLAFSVGYFLSAGAVAFGSLLFFGITGGEQAAAAMRRGLLSIAGALLYGSHTITMTGAAPADKLSIHPTVTSLSIVPILALILGGYIAAGTVNHRIGPWNSALRGLRIAPLYAAIALVFRPLFAVQLAPFAGLQIEGVQAELPPIALGPSFADTLLLTLVFSAVFGAVGGMFAAAPDHSGGHLGRRARVPAWLRGALIAFLTMQLLLTMLFLVGGLGAVGLHRDELAHRGISRISAAAAILLAPEAAGAAGYLAEGVQLKADFSTWGGRRLLQSNRLSLAVLSGIREETSSFGSEKPEVRFHRTPRYSPLVMLFAAVVFVFAGQLAARSSTWNRWLLGITIAAAHTAILLLLAPLYSGSFIRILQGPHGGLRTSAEFGFALPSTVYCPFLIALVFCTIGTVTAPRREGFRG